MMSKQRTKQSLYQEVIFQIILHIVVFIFYTYNRDQPNIKEHQIFFFLSYAAAAAVINYWLLPTFYYRKKYLLFFLFTLLTITGVILVEEFVIEQIYFPDTRGKRFPGVFFSLWGVLPVITILAGGKFAWDALGKQRELETLREAVKESELQFLKSQINPHFLFNNLNNLYSYAIEKSPKTTDIILELSGVLRYMLYECKEAFVPLPKEIQQMKNFVNLNEMQIEERGKVNFTTKNIHGNYQIAPLILIVFIENAFKHSTASQSDNIEIDIEIELLENGELKFNCKNTYQPQSNTENLTKGIGLQNVKKRLGLLYPNAHELTIKDQGNEFEVQLGLSLQMNK